jgi:hypothetical protein
MKTCESGPPQAKWCFEEPGLAYQGSDGTPLPVGDSGGAPSQQRVDIRQRRRSGGRVECIGLSQNEQVDESQSRYFRFEVD